MKYFSAVAISIDQYFAEHFAPWGVTPRGMDSKFSRNPLSYLNVRLAWNHPVRRTRDSCDIFQNETALPNVYAENRLIHIPYTFLRQRCDCCTIPAFGKEFSESLSRIVNRYY